MADEITTDTPTDTPPTSLPDAPPAPPEAVPEAAPAMPAAPVVPNYHVSIWDMPDPTYVCLLCPYPQPHLSLDAIQAHMREVHDVEPAPTETMDMLLGLRRDADARMAAEAEATAAAREAAQEVVQEDSQESTQEDLQESTPDVPPEEEAPHAG